MRQPLPLERAKRLLRLAWGGNNGQCGANAHQIGPQVLAQALALHYESGLPMRRVPQVIAKTTGISITQCAYHSTIAPGISKTATSSIV